MPGVLTVDVSYKLCYQQFLSKYDTNSYSESLIKQINNPFWSESYSSVIQLKEKNTTEYFLSSPSNFSQSRNTNRKKKQSFISSGITKEFAILMICSKKNGEFYTELELVHKYNIKTNFLQFNGLKTAIKVLYNILNQNSYSPTSKEK